MPFCYNYDQRTGSIVTTWLRKSQKADTKIREISKLILIILVRNGVCIGTKKTGNFDILEKRDII